MKGVQCYELFGGIALKNHTFSLICLRQNLIPSQHNYYVAVIMFMYDISFMFTWKCMII